jgi:hypothetical protein
LVITLDWTDSFFEQTYTYWIFNKPPTALPHCEGYGNIMSVELVSLTALLSVYETLFFHGVAESCEVGLETG